MTVIKMWMLLTPEGEVMEVSTHKSTILDDLFESPSDWQDKVDAGYRLIRAQVERSSLVEIP